MEGPPSPRFATAPSARPRPAKARGKAAAGAAVHCIFIVVYNGGDHPGLQPTMIEPRKLAVAVAGFCTAGSSIGGFCGRFIPGMLDDLIGWRGAFVVLAALSLLGAIAVLLLLPREKRFLRSPGLVASAGQMLAHLRKAQLLA